jgi:hypothetical protein
MPFARLPLAFPFRQAIGPSGIRQGIDLATVKMPVFSPMNPHLFPLPKIILTFLLTSFSVPPSLSVVKSKRLKPIAIAALFIALILIQAYLESHFGITPNH